MSRRRETAERNEHLEEGRRIRNSIDRADEVMRSLK
jgi:hypothetical protein